MPLSYLSRWAWGAGRGKPWHLPVKNTNPSIGAVFGAFLPGKPPRMAFYVFFFMSSSDEACASCVGRPKVAVPDCAALHPGYVFLSEDQLRWNDGIFCGCASFSAVR